MPSASIKQISFFAVLVIICALAFGGVLHSIIPHEHTHPTAARIQHSALLHTEKYLLLLALISVFAFSTALGVISSGFATRARLEQIHIWSEQRALRRGILAYRKFR